MPGSRCQVSLHPYLIPNADIQRLLWVPGIGKVNAFTIYTEIDGINRFLSAKQFFSYCRLVEEQQRDTKSGEPSSPLRDPTYP